MFSLRLVTLFIVLYPLLIQAENLRLTPEQLKQSLSDYVILDARSASDYQSGHIKGAINFPIDLSYQHKNINGKITEPVKMQAYFRERGIEQSSKIVIYDSGNLVDAARLFWSLEVYGIKDVKVLDHGFDHWLNKSYPISLEQPKRKNSHYVAAINHKRLASKFSTQLATQNPNQFIIDARAIPAYQGKTSTAKRFGHIPTSANYPASHNLNINENIASLQPLDRLKEIYSDVPKNKKIIIYCAIGRISSANYLALRELDYDVSNYDASWKEWGNDFSLPIEN